MTSAVTDTNDPCPDCGAKLKRIKQVVGIGAWYGPRWCASCGWDSCGWDSEYDEYDASMGGDDEPHTPPSERAPGKPVNRG